MPSLVTFPAAVLHILLMGPTITIRLSEELAAWLEEAAVRSDVSRSKLIRSPPWKPLA
jgi:hypothetical protein